MLDNHILKAILYVLGGGAIGSLITYTLTKNKYESILNEEIAEVKEAYRKRAEELAPPVEVVPENQPELFNERDVVTVVNTLSNYVPQNSIDMEALNKQVAKPSGPESAVVITFEQFEGEESGYEKRTWVYYAGDETLATEEDEIVEDTFYYLGESFNGTFEEFETIYIRNPRISTDFEVVRDPGTYKEMVLGEYES